MSITPTNYQQEQSVMLSPEGSSEERKGLEEEKVATLFQAQELLRQRSHTQNTPKDARILCVEIVPKGHSEWWRSSRKNLNQAFDLAVKNDHSITHDMINSCLPDFEEFSNVNLGLAFSWAVSKGHFEIVQALVECDRFNDIPNQLLLSEREAAERLGYHDIAQILKTAYRKNRFRSFCWENAIPIAASAIAGILIEFYKENGLFTIGESREL